MVVYEVVVVVIHEHWQRMQVTSMTGRAANLEARKFHFQISQLKMVERNEYRAIIYTSHACYTVAIERVA